MKLLIYRLLIVLGAIVAASSLFFLGVNIAAFVVVFLIGLNVLVFSSLRYKLAKKKPLVAFEKPRSTPLAMRMKLPQQQLPHPSFFKRLFGGKRVATQQKIDTGIAQKKIEPVVSTKKTDVSVINDQKIDEKTKMKVFQHYLVKAIKSGYPKDKVKEAAMQSGWPSEVFDKTYAGVARNYRSMRVLLAIVLSLVVVFLLYYLSKKDVLLFSYWMQTLRQASPIFFVGLIVLFFGISLVFMLKIRVAMKMKSIEYRVIEQKTVSEIKNMLVNVNEGYQTDLDKLYQVLAERGKLNINEIALIFGISKEQAEEWGKILKDQDLATLHYPAVGEPELLWKKLKSTE